MGYIQIHIGGEVTSNKGALCPTIMGVGWRISGDIPTPMCQPVITIITLPGKVYSYNS